MPAGHFYKVQGDQRLQDLEQNMVKIQVTISQMNTSIKYANKVISILKSDNSDLEVAEAYSIACMTHYMKAFNSNGCYGLDKNILFEDTVNGDPTQSLSMREFHNLIREYRNKHFAHSDSLHTASTVGVAEIDSNLGVCPFIAERKVLEGIQFYQQIVKLCEVVNEYLQDKFQPLADELIQKITDGTYSVSTNKATITPIPSNQTLREFWGLPERDD